MTLQNGQADERRNARWNRLSLIVMAIVFGILISANVLLSLVFSGFLSGTTLTDSQGNMMVAPTATSSLRSPPGPLPSVSSITSADPAADNDGDTIPNGTDRDDDNDGCTDEQELGTNRLFGGQRNPLDFWDFFDPNRDGSVSFQDFLEVLARAGAVGDPTIDPLSDPSPPPAYHTRFDRTGASGTSPWRLGPPDGAIGLRDFLALLTQFGHTCA